MKQLLLSMALCLVSLSVTTNASAAMSMNELLAKVKAGSAKDNRVFAQREARFNREFGQRASMLNQVKAERTREEARSEQLEAMYKQNEEQLEALRSKLSEELGDLKELFGVIQQSAGEASANFKTSITSAQFEGRSEKLSSLSQKMSQSDELVSVTDIEDLWYELQRELSEQGKITTFQAKVSASSGEKSERNVTRVGTFNLVSDGKFVNYADSSGLNELARQPQGRFLSQAEGLESASANELVSFSVDPTQGQLLGALVESPSVLERVNQGGTVGYVIVVMGIVSFIIAIWKLITLAGVSSKVSKQVKNQKKPSKNNPLGRILRVYHKNKEADLESLELRLGEAIMKETPKLNSWLMALKIIAVVAPLMGLLGTVTGMIQTFQSITLFGSGDPKLMAGGISQALVTTVLGLVVAIPTVLLHTAAAGRAKRLQEILEEQSTGMIAEQSEQANG